jgi:hypothetical protein
MVKKHKIRIATDVAGTAGQWMLAGAIGAMYRFARFWGETALMVRELRER